MRDEWTDKTILWEVVANFDAGNSTEEVDAFPGMPGDGWASRWDVTEQGTGHCTATAQNTSPVDDGYYLSVAVNNPAGATYSNVSRSYAIEDETDKRINLKVYHRIQFSLRIDEATIADLDSAVDKYVISLSSAATTDMGPRDVFCIFATGDAAEYGEQAVRKWALINGDRKGEIDSVIGSGVSLTSGGTYFFEIDVNAEDRTYQVRITSGAASFESEILDWRTADDNAGGHLNFICRCDSPDDTRAFSLDSIKITQEPGCLVKPAPFDSQCLCGEICTSCNFVPPNINTDKCVHPYIKLTRHDDLATDDSTLPPWAYYHMTDFCMAGHETLLTCCGCFSWEYTLYDDFGVKIEDYVVITYPWIACENPIEITGTDNCSFHRTIAYQAVYLSFHFVRDEYLAWKNAKEGGSFDDMTRAEELAACNLKCFKQVHFGAEYSERNFRFQGGSAVDLSAYFWLPPSPYASYDGEGKLILDTEDAGSVSEAIHETEVESEQAVIYTQEGPKPYPDGSQPGWDIEVLIFEEDIQGIESDAYAAEMKQNIDYTAGGIGTNYMVGTDCQLYMAVPPCHWISKGVSVQVQHDDVTLTFPTIEWTHDQYGGDPFGQTLEGPLIWTQSDLPLYHTGDSSTCFFPCKYINPSKRAIAGYRTNGSNFTLDRTRTLNAGQINKSFFFRLGYDSSSGNWPIDGTESFAWTSPGYIVDEYNQVLCGTDPRTTELVIPPASGGGTFFHPHVGTVSYSIQCQLDVAIKRVYFTSAYFSVSAYAVSREDTITYSRAQLNSATSPILLEPGTEILVPREVPYYPPGSYTIAWQPATPVVLTFGVEDLS